MIIALGVLFITSLILATVFVAANGDIKLTSTNTNQKKAYYAALAGLSAYKFHLNSEATYWQKCPSIPSSGTGSATVPGAEESYTVSTMSSTGHNETECKAGKQAAILETSGSAHGTFRVKSVGTAGTGTQKSTRTLIATFNHPGFINYVYFTNYEILDPAAQSPEPTKCEHYYAYRLANNLIGECGTIVFAAGDKINGPMHTNDAAALCAESTSKPTFGRKGHEDKIEMNGGHYAGCGSSSNSLQIYGEYTEKGATLTPPTSDAELIEGAEYKLKGKVFLELKTGVPNTIAIRHESMSATPEIKNFPSNGVIYVENNGACSLKYTPYGTDYTGDTNCGNVYVEGEYTESLTIAAANDVIVDGNLTTTHESSGEPTGSAVLGLIATNFVRVSHPVAKEYEIAHSIPHTETPIIVHKEEAPHIKEKTLEETPNKSEKTLEKAPTITEETLEEKPTVSKGKESCPTGYTLTNKKCIKKVTVESCPNGYTLTNKKCIEKVTEETCNTGYTLTNKKCIKKVTEETCNTGYTLTNKKCVATVSEETCGSGYTLNGNKLCVASCPNGQSYTEAEGICTGSCESNDRSLGGGKCEYENSHSGCDAPNLNATEDPNKMGGTFEPTIDAAMLSTAHSFIVDNFKCGKHIGNLNVWGSIAQDWRGAVGQSDAGFTKNYNYDGRLETLQPPDFLTPTSTALTLTRVTAVPNS